MTDDLSALPEDVREAMTRLEHYLHITINGEHFRGSDYDIIRAELLRLVSDNCGMHEALCEHDELCEQLTIMRQRVERAEAELAALKSQPISRPAQDAIIRFGCGEVLSHEEMCEIVNQAVCAGRELAALKARIAVAPVIVFPTARHRDDAFYGQLIEWAKGVVFTKSGQRVALVKVED